MISPHFKEKYSEAYTGIISCSGLKSKVYIKRHKKKYLLPANMAEKVGFRGLIIPKTSILGQADLWSKG
jgi:hypothetical protein